MGKISHLKIQNHRILDICLEVISTKVGWSRSKIDKIKTRDILPIKPIYKLWKIVQWRHPVLNFMFRFRQQWFLWNPNNTLAMNHPPTQILTMLGLKKKTYEILDGP